MCVYVHRDGEDLDSQGDGSSQPDTISLASRTSQNTLDSDKVRIHLLSMRRTLKPFRASNVDLSKFTDENVLYCIYKLYMLYCIYKFCTVLQYLYYYFEIVFHFSF